MSNENSDSYYYESYSNKKIIGTFHSKLVTHYFGCFFGFINLKIDNKPVQDEPYKSDGLVFEIPIEHVPKELLNAKKGDVFLLSLGKNIKLENATKLS